MSKSIKDKKSYIDTIVISQNFPPVEGGIQTYMYEIAEKWMSGKSYVLCETKNDEFIYQSDPFEVFRFKNTPLSYLKSAYIISKILFQKPNNFLGSVVFFILLLLNRNILITMIPLAQQLKGILSKSSNPIVIQCSKTLHIGAVGMIGKLLYNHPLIIYIHGTELNKYDLKININLLYKFIIRKADVVISNSTFTKQLAIEKGGKEKNIEVVKLGADIQNFYPQDTKLKIYKKHEINSQNKVLLTISHLIERKGHELVLYALQNIIKTNNKIHYIIVGQGEYLQKLKSIVSHLDLTQYVTFTGFVENEEIPSYMNACDIFVMPNRQIDKDFEGYGIVFLEANACCKPVIGGDSGGVSDAVLDQKTGLLVKPNDIEDLTDKILKLLNNDELSSKLANNGFERVRLELNWVNVISSINKIILKKI